MSTKIKKYLELFLNGFITKEEFKEKAGIDIKSLKNRGDMVK